VDSRAHGTAQHEARRRAIIDAAAEVLRTRGLSACTARSIAGAGPLTKSALHYYFEDIDEVIDLAFRSLMDSFYERLTATAAEATNPDEALWSTARAYLHLGTDRPGSTGRRVPMLWFEMQVAATRAGDLDTVRAITERVLQLFIHLVADTGVPRPTETGTALMNALIGIVVRADMDVSDEIDLDAELCSVAALLGLLPPATVAADSR
jgi:AcrR family transcriptional regulator